MATMTQMPTPPPDHGGIRPDRGEKNPTVAAADHEDWARELREQLKRNMEETLREQEKEIEDEIRVQLDEAIKSGMYSAEDRKDHLSRLRHAKEQRLRRMRAMLLEEGEERIREERTLRQWSVDGGFPTGDSELAEAFKREQQALLDKFAKDGRNSTSSSPTAERQKIRSSSPPPATSSASKPPETIRPSAPRISPTNSASSAHTQSSQTYQQQQRKASNQHIWKPPVQPSETGHPRTSSISANAKAGSSTPQRAGSMADNSARWHVGANTSYAATTAYRSQYHSVQTPAPAPTLSSYPSPYSDIQNKPQPQTPWLAELTTGYFYDDPEEISETDDEDNQDSHSDADDDEYSEDDAMPSQAWHGSLRGMPPKSSPRIIQGDRGRGRGRGQGVRATVPSQHHYEVKHSSTDLRGKYETSQPRAVPSVNANIHRSTERPFVVENAREEHKPPKVWKPASDGHGEDSRPSQARPIPSSNTTRNQEHAAYGEGTSFGSYGSYGSTSNLGYGLPSRRPSSANVVPLPMTPEEREKFEREKSELREVDKKWEKMDKARGLESQTSPLPPSQPPISTASRSTIPVPQTSTARQRTPEPPSASPKPGSGSFRDKIWMPKEAPSGTKPLHDRERERSDSLSASRSPPHSQPQPQPQPQRHPQPLPQPHPQPQPSTSRSRNDSEASASRNAERYNPQNSPQPPVTFAAPPSKVPSPRPAQPIRRPSPSPSTESYSSDMYESDFSYDSQPSAVPMSRQPTEEFLPEPNDRDRFAPRNIVDKKSDDNPSMSSKSRNKGSTDEPESSTSQSPSELKRKAEELRQLEEALAQRQKEVAEREEALARREEEDRRRRENEVKLRELAKKAEEERVKEERRKEEEKARDRHREEEEKREQRRKEEELARQRQREEDRKKEEERRKEEERKREERRKEEEMAREIEREEERVRREQERKDREQAEFMQREEEARARTQDKLWHEAKERNARQNSFAADRPMSTASFASAASSASFASRASTTSNSSGSSSYSTWSTNSGRSTASSATSASTAPDPIRKSSTSSASTAWGASPGGRSSASASTTPKASSTPRPTPTTSFPPKGPGGSPASASTGGASTSYEEWERKQQERMKAQQEQFQRDQMRAEQEKLRASSAASGTDTIMVAWSSYEREWNGLKDKSDGSLTWRTFPWPMMKKPSDPEDLTANGIGALLLSVHHSNEKANRDRLKEQLLRWHPDRFENRWLKKVSDKDQEKVRNGAGQVVRALNELMTRENNLASGGGLF